MHKKDNRTVRDILLGEAAILNHSRAAIGCPESAVADLVPFSSAGLSAFVAGVPFLGLSSGPVSSAHAKRLMERVVSQSGVFLTGGRHFATAAALAACIGMAGAQYAHGADVTVSGSGAVSAGLSLGTGLTYSNMDVLSNGSAVSTTISGGGRQYVSSGGVASTTSIGVGGTLWIDSGANIVSINGPVHGELQGYGSIFGDVTIASGGILAAGGAYDSASTANYGSMTVSGDLTLNSGGIYMVRVDSASTNADGVLATGSATVSGAAFRYVANSGATGADYVSGSWQVLSAGGGVYGEFDKNATTTTLAFFDAVLDYSTSNEVWVGFNRSMDFIAYADTFNRTGVASGLTSLESINPSNALVQAILGLDAAAIPALYNQLSGEMHVSLQGGLMLLDREFSHWILERSSRNARARTILSASSPSFEGANALASLNPRVSESRFLNNFWADVGYARQGVDGDSNTGRYTMKGPEISIGYDHIAPAGWLGGVAFRYADRDIEVNSRLSEADIDSYSIALHGGFQTAFGPGSARLTLGGVYTRHEIDGKRDVVIGSNRQRLESDYYANSYQLFMEGAYAIPLGRVWVEPFVDLDWTSTHIPGFTEKGGNAALRAHSQSRNNLSQLFGVRLALPVVHRVGIEAQAGWRHTYGKIDKASAFTFIEGGSRFGIKGSTLNRDEAVFDLRAAYQVRDNLRLGLECNAAVGERGNTLRGGAFIALEW